MHRGRNHFCRYCLQAFRTADILKSDIKDCIKYNGKMLENGEYVKFKNYESKKSLHLRFTQALKVL